MVRVCVLRKCSKTFVQHFIFLIRICDTITTYQYKVHPWDVILSLHAPYYDSFLCSSRSSRDGNAYSICRGRSNIISSGIMGVNVQIIAGANCLIAHYIQRCLVVFVV